MKELTLEDLSREELLEWIHRRKLRLGASHQSDLLAIRLEFRAAEVEFLYEKYRGAQDAYVRVRDAWMKEDEGCAEEGRLWLLCRRLRFAAGEAQNDHQRAMDDLHSVRRAHEAVRGARS